MHIRQFFHSKEHHKVAGESQSRRVASVDGTKQGFQRTIHFSSMKIMHL